jgi:hypothetical protein
VGRLRGSRRIGDRVVLFCTKAIDAWVGTCILRYPVTLPRLLLEQFLSSSVVRTTLVVDTRSPYRLQCRLMKLTWPHSRLAPSLWDCLEMRMRVLRSFSNSRSNDCTCSFCTLDTLSVRTSTRNQSSIDLPLYFVERGFKHRT